VEELTIRVSELQAENDKYVEIAEKAEYLADTLQVVDVYSGFVKHCPREVVMRMTHENFSNENQFTYLLL